MDQYAFQFYQFQRKDIVTIGKEEMETLPEGPPITWKRSELIKNPPGRRLFFIEREPFLFLNGVFHPISEQVARKFFTSEANLRFFPKYSAISNWKAVLSGVR